MLKATAGVWKGGGGQQKEGERRLCGYSSVAKLIGFEKTVTDTNALHESWEWKAVPLISVCLASGSLR